jgi:CelD/BcsL family acetyltransferase involved in cellulose biosynthesis/ActR/RegA family two-component response regulator
MEMQYGVVSVIDDDPSVREGATDLLESAGIATKSFQDADEFLRSDYLDSTSCVVADIRMPGMSGIELHEQLCRAGIAIPTILVTAFPRDRDRIRARQNGVWGYLKKPFGEKEFLAFVNSALHGTKPTSSDHEDETINQDSDDEPVIEQIGKAGALSIEELSGPDALETITPEWERLDEQLSPRTPFTSPLWVKLWWRHLRQVTPGIRQEFFVHTVRDETGELLAIAPLIITHRPGIGPLQLRILQFFGGADGSITEHRCMICRGHDEARAARALTSYLYDRKETWDLFLWTGIRHNQIAQDPENQLHLYKKTPYYLVPLPKSWEEFRSGLSPNMKEAMRKCYRHLTRGGHSFIFRVVTKPEEISTALDRLFDLHSERAQLKYATRHRDLFAKSSHRTFIIDVANKMAEQNQLRIFELEVAGNVVASRMAFLLGDELYLYYSGYDLEWRKHSIMTTLMCECFKWAIESGISVINLSKGKDPSKLRWRGSEVEFHDALLMSPTRRGALVSRAYSLLSGHPSLFVKLTELLILVFTLLDLTRHVAAEFV